MRSCVFVWILFAFAAPMMASPPEAQTGKPLEFSACYAPGTPWSKVLELASASAPMSVAPSTSLGPGGGPQSYQYSDGSRWSVTATDGGGLAQGDPTTLTWSIVPDGTSIHGYAGEPVSDSNLRAFLNSIYGSEAVWLPLFQSVFDRWSQLNGVTYVYEPNDDGSPWTELTIASGVLGVRGDVRISGHFIDGNSGILAYNFFPNFGDMVIDTGDGFYTSTGGNSLRLRNVLAHEHGHGMGLSHSCPVDQTKLMEPFATTAFDGPQHDDILATNRGYGDPNEHNDASGASTDLGPISGTFDETGRSIDGTFDEDWYRFTANPGELVDVTLIPVGWTYLSGPQNSNGSCSPGTNFDSLSQNDMGLEILDTDGVSTLAMSTSNPIGAAEWVNNQLLETGGTYFVRVIPGFEDAAQLYDLSLNVTPAICTESDLLLSSQTIHNKQTFTRCTIQASADFVITGNAEVTFNAGKTVVFGNGVSIEGGTVQVTLDPSLIQ